MKKQMVFCALFIIALQSKVGSADTWGVKELLASSEAATEHLKESVGQAQYDKITAVSVELNAQKVAAKAKVTYQENGAAKTVSYFCHEHGDAIDCH